MALRMIVAVGLLCLCFDITSVAGYCARTNEGGVMTCKEGPKTWGSMLCENQKTCETHHDCNGVWCGDLPTCVKHKCKKGVLVDNAAVVQGETDAVCCEDWDAALLACPLLDNAKPDFKVVCPNGAEKCVADLTCDQLKKVCDEFGKDGKDGACRKNPLALEFLSKPCRVFPPEGSARPDIFDGTLICCDTYTCTDGTRKSNAGSIWGSSKYECCDDPNSADTSTGPTLIADADVDGATTISASILAFVGSFVILLA